MATPMAPAPSTTMSANTRARKYRASKHPKRTTRDAGTIRTGAGYVRISKIAGRPDQISDEIQKRAIIGMAIAKGIDPDGIIWFYDYGQSAWEDKSPRPGFRDSLEAIRTGKRNTLLAYRVDRIYRNHRAMMALRDDLDEWGGSLILASEGVDTWDEENIATRITFSMHAALAEQESATKSERMTDWHAERLEDKTGALPPGGPRPYGYIRERIPAVGRDGTVPSLAIDRAEAKVIRAAAKRILDGEGLKGVAASLECPSGRKLSRTGLKHILTSETTAGLRFDGTTHYVGNWPPILDREQWDALCATLHDPNRLTPGPRSERRHLLAGMITCGVCGSIMYTRTHTTGPRYGCSAATCFNSIVATAADDAVFKHMSENIDPTTWATMRASGRGNQANVIEAFNRKLAIITDDYINGPASPDADAEYKRARAMIHASITKAQESTPMELPDVDDWITAWREGMEIDHKRLIINAWFETLTLAPHVKGITPSDRLSYKWRNA